MGGLGNAWPRAGALAGLVLLAACGATTHSGDPDALPSAGRPGSSGAGSSETTGGRPDDLGSTAATGGTSGGSGLTPPNSPNSPNSPSSCEGNELLKVLPADFQTSDAMLSADGQIAVGNASFDAFKGATGALRWRADTNSVDVVLGGAGVAASALSADGAIVLGKDALGDWIWNEGAVSRLPFDRVPSYCATRLSRDGSAAVGCLERQSVVVRGARQLLIEPLPPGTNRSLPLAISRDGSAVAGIAYAWNPGQGETRDQRPFIWTAERGVQNIELPTGMVDGRPFAVSDNGRSALLTANGLSTEITIWPPLTARWSESGEVDLLEFASEVLTNSELSVAVGSWQQLFRWTLESGVTSFANETKLGFGAVIAMSGDGRRVLVSAAIGELGVPSRGPLLWDLELGFLSSEQVMRRIGSTLWSDATAYAISESGEHILARAACNGAYQIIRLTLPN